MNTPEAAERKAVIIKATWEYLLKVGLANASIGELCRETKFSQSSLYYWFENKDDLWIEAGKYGTSKVVDALLEYTFNHTTRIKEYFNNLLNEVEKYKYDLRLAVQITTSPLFGGRMREKAHDFRFFYEEFAKRLISVFNCSHHQAEVFIYSIISFVIDYAVWDDREKTQMLLENLYRRILFELNLKEEEISN